MLTIALALAALLAAPAAQAHDLRGARPSLASLPVLPAASESPDAPDLRIALPSVRYTGQSRRSTSTPTSAPGACCTASTR